MMEYLTFAFSSFWHFAGCFLALCIVTFMAGNLGWRVAYLCAVVFRGWPRGEAQDVPGLNDNISL